MRNFIDDSGSFNWQDKGRSLFCGVTIAERSLPVVLERFDRWRSSVIGVRSTRELKGAELTPRQLDSFADKVLMGADRDVWLTVVAADTRLTDERLVRMLAEQASAMFQRASDMCAEEGNRSLKEYYHQLSGWARNRSPENVLWLAALEEVVTQTLQHCIVRFLEPGDESEFTSLSIAIDESFIRRDAHVAFWREWFRVAMMRHAERNPLIIPRGWREQGHPFIRRFEIHPGVLDLNQLYVRDTGFSRSKDVPGLQIADICANICYRYHRGERGLPAYHRLSPRIVGRDGREVTVVHIDESSLHQDDPRHHVTPLDLEQYKRHADELRSKARTKQWAAAPVTSTTTGIHAHRASSRHIRAIESDTTPATKSPGPHST